MLRCHTGTAGRKDQVRTRDERSRQQLLETQRRPSGVERVEPDPLRISAYHARVFDDDDSCQRPTYQPAGGSHGMPT